MKREFLKGLTIEIDGKQVNLSDAVIDSIISENGKDIEATKAKTDKSQEIENLKTQLSEKDKLIEEANVQIENFKGMDVEGTKKAADEWKLKSEQAAADLKAKEEEFQKKLQEQQYDFKLNELSGQHKFVDDIAKEAFVNNLKKQEFKFGEDGTLQGANDYINKFKEDHKGIFVVEEAPKDEPGIPKLVTSTGGTVKQESGSKFGFNFNTVRPLPKE